MPNRAPHSFYMLPTNNDEILSICANFVSKDSAGYDEISSTIAKSTMQCIISPLTDIINCSFETGIIPNDIKIAKVIPVYKSGPKDVFSNYRPISVLPFFSKIFEKLAYNRLLNHIEKHAILNPNQYGFRKNHSTDMALIDITDKISQAIDNRLYSAGIFIDLSKAFDTVDHLILLSKLEHYGIRGMPLEWFQNYLSSRQQFVSINGESSNKLPVTCGVPQGSILGPLLFLIYINDIASSSKSLQFILFADDTNLFMSSNNLEDLQQKLISELAGLSCWFKANKLSLNLDKTSYMLFSGKGNRVPVANFSLHIDNTIIKRVDNCKFLGVYLDENLSWSVHIDKISNKISKTIGVISRIRYKFDSTTLLMLYNIMVLPYLNYCCIVWGANYFGRLECLLKLQKRMIRIITGLKKRDHTSQIFKSLNVLKVTEINVLQTSLFMYKLYNRLLPENFSSFLCLNNDLHEHYTRSQKNFHLISVRTNIRKFSLKFRGSIIWNKLPEIYRFAISISSFKKLVKDCLINGHFDIIS